MFNYHTFHRVKNSSDQHTRTLLFACNIVRFSHDDVQIIVVCLKSIDLKRPLGYFHFLTAGYLRIKIIILLWLASIVHFLCYL